MTSWLAAALTAIALAPGEEAACSLFRWEPAEGPVSGYLLWVEGEVTGRWSFGSLGLVCAQRGALYRFQVLAHDELGRLGPPSEWSDWHRVVGTGDAIPCP